MAQKERATKSRVLGTIGWYIARSWTRAEIIAGLQNKYSHLQQSLANRWIQHVYDTRRAATSVGRMNATTNVSPQNMPTLADNPTGLRATVKFTFRRPNGTTIVEHIQYFDFAGPMTKQQLMEEIRNKIIDDIMSKYQGRVTRRDTVDRLIQSIDLFRMEGI